MNSGLLVSVKAINGGLFVAAFALIGEALKPKRFAGLFSPAPSVALANLLVTVLAKGDTDGHLNGVGMVVGAAAMTLICLVGILVVRRWGAVRASTTLCGSWLVLAEVGYLVFLR